MILLNAVDSFFNKIWLNNFFYFNLVLWYFQTGITFRVFEKNSMQENIFKTFILPVCLEVNKTKKYWNVSFQSLSISQLTQTYVGNKKQ